METITIKSNTNYFIHNCFAGTRKIYLNNNNIEFENTEFYGEKSKYKRLTKISTNEENIYIILGGYKIKLIDKITNCNILLSELEFHDIVLKNTNNFDIICNIEYSNDITENETIYFGNNQLIQNSGMLGVKNEKLL
jgi:hypothetical protein